MSPFLMNILIITDPYLIFIVNLDSDPKHNDLIWT
jgi:hypothetical protein